MTPRLLGPYRKEWMVVLGSRGQTEVLYRSQTREWAERLLPGVVSAVSRGIREAARGWPQVLPERSPIWVVEQADLWRITERHPRWSWGDRTAYASPSEVDCRLALKALRRAATIAAQRAS